MGKVFSFINYKGGVGKTTLAVEISAAIAFNLDVRVLLIDVDPQTNATFYLMYEEEWNDWATNKGTLREVFHNFLSGKSTDVRPMIVNFDYPKMRNLFLLPSHVDLLPMDLRLASHYGPESARAIKLLKEICDDLKREYEAIICDCPPNLNLITQNAIVASDALAIIAMPEYLSVIGIDWIFRTRDEIVSRINEELKPFNAPTFRGPEIKAIIFNRVRATKVHEYMMREVKKKRGEIVFDSYLSESIKIGERPEMKIPIALSDWRADEKYVNQLNQIIDEFITKVY